ncbi:MAG: patatin-like phospholipase family protein [Vicinamibacteraceae bacterium]|nr:patatin-like phospholipase family protein [Vicinamibacteraceae bacterium]
MPTRILLACALVAAGVVGADAAASRPGVQTPASGTPAPQVPSTQAPAGRPPVVDPVSEITPIERGPIGRPRIGLALGGGAAKGIAHIGVLEWLEEHRVPVDIIVGTSMGGLVAGAYATGMTPSEIRELLKSADWDLMFLSDTPFRYKAYRRKQDARVHPSQLEFGLKGGLRLPSGLNPGQQITLLLDRIAMPYAGVTSFDDLPTPFRCVATDLRTASFVVLRDGSLAEAMRATMAIPGVFTPVSIRDHILVDGGVLNNVPANVVRALGADVVIAVDVGGSPDDEEERLESLFDLLGKTIDTWMTAETRRAIASADIVIRPELKGLGGSSWRAVDELAQRGRQAAERQAGLLTAHALPAPQHAEQLADRQARRRTEVIVPGFVDVEPPDLSPRQVERIRSIFEPSLGRPLDADLLRDQVLTAAGSDRFEWISFSPVEREGRAGLAVRAKPKSYGPPFMAVSLELGNIDAANFAVTLAARVTAFDLAGAGSELRTDFAVGTRKLAAAELYRPLGKAGLFVAPRAYVSRRQRNTYSEKELVGEYRVTRAGIGGDIGWTFGRTAEFRTGFDLADFRGRRRVGSPELPDLDGFERVFNAQFVYDGQTSPLVPTRGIHTRLTYRYYFDAATATLPGEDRPPEKFSQVEATATWFRRARGGEDRVFVHSAGGSSFGRYPQVNRFTLGGPFRLGGSYNERFSGANYVLATGGYLKSVGRLPEILGAGLFIGGWLENGTAFDRWSDQDWQTDFTVGFIGESIFGPLFAGTSLSLDGGWRFYVSLSPLFRCESCAPWGD